MNRKASKAVGHDETNESLRALMARIAGELVGIAGTVEDTQSVITRLTWRMASQDPAYSEAMQKADLISQELTGLASFIQKLTEELPTNIKVDATGARSSLTLSDLARRLAA